MILLSLRYKWSIIGSIICSFLIAVLWSASISTIFPVVKIVLESKTAHTWVQEEIDKAEKSKLSLEAKIAALQQELVQLPADEAAVIHNKIALDQDRLDGEASAIDRYKKIQPYINKWAPETPFATLVYAMIWLLVTSILKGLLLVLSAILVARVSSATVMDLRRIYYRKALELDQLRIDRLGASNMMTHLSHNMLMVGGGVKAFYGKCVREPLKMIV